MALILLADDDELVQETAREAFERYGHRLGVVGNGEDALKALACKQPDLLILDCNMPRMTGILALREIRKSPHFWWLPVMMLTSRASSVDRDLALQDGANGYLTKPFDPDTLVFRAEDLIAQRSARQTGR